MTLSEHLLLVGMFSVLVYHARAQECQVNSLKPQNDFDFDKSLCSYFKNYMGRWYQYKWYSDYTFSKSTWMDDYIQSYIPIGDGNATTYIEGRVIRNGECNYDAAKLQSTSSPDKFQFTAGAFTAPYLVLETDYTQYAFVYGCFNVSDSGTCNGVNAWIFGRTPTVPQIVKDKAQEYYSRICIDKDKFIITKQTNVCPLKQQWSVTEGQECRVDKLQVTSDFNSTMFTGVWYEISWLPETYVTDADLSRDKMNEVFVSGNGDLTTYFRHRESGKCKYGKEVFKKTDNQGRYTMGQDASPILMADTDYEDYAVVYVCLKQNTTSGECLSSRVYVWGRRTSLTWSQQIRVNSVLQDLCINPSAMSSTLHENGCVPEERTCPPASSAPSTTMCSAATTTMLTLLVISK